MAIIQKIPSQYISALLVLFSFFSGLLLPIFGLFLFKAVEQQNLFEKSIFYFTILSISLITIIAISILSYKLKWLKLLVYAPEESALYDTPAKKYLTFANYVHFGIIFGLLMALFSVITQTFFFSLPNTEFQVTETGKLILSWEPAVTSETIFLVVLLSLVYSNLRRFTDKRNFGQSGKYITYFITIIASTLLWTAIHFARYGSQESGLFATILFGAASGVYIILTGSGIGIYFWHTFGNLFLKAQELFASDSVKLTIVALLLIYIITLIIVKVIKRR